MISGQEEIAEKYRAQGQGKKQEILGRQVQRKKEIMSKAEKSVIELRLRLENLSTVDIPLDKTVLFGFSQGGAMALASGFSLPLAGLIICSGYPHKELIISGKVPPVFLSHGNDDPVVPLQATKELI